jgi:UMF1 family MFS transporter
LDFIPPGFLPHVRNDDKNIFGWCMYDWANSAYYTTVVAGVLPVYFAEVVVPPGGIRVGGTVYTPTTAWAYVIGLASFIAFLLAPVLGAISDFSATKKRFLLSFAYSGALFTMLLYFSGSGDVYWTLMVFLLAQVGYIGANVFYDAFISEIVSEEKMDWISGKGYSYGYVGGGLQFAASLVLIAGHDWFGLSQVTAVRIAILGAALWWAGFSLFTVRHLSEARGASRVPAGYSRPLRAADYVAIGVSRTVETIRRVRQFRHLALFLLAFMLYSDGIQTVIDMATIYGKNELKLSTTVLMLTLMISQIVGAVGALVFSWIAVRIGSKHAIMITLIIWSGVVIYAYFIETATQYLAMGGVVGIVLGGSQALSRSFYGSMVPKEASAEFFGFYTVFSRFSAIWGPMTFGIVEQTLGSARLAIVSVIFFFVAGLVLLAFVNEEKARGAREQRLFDSQYSQG